MEQSDAEVFGRVGKSVTIGGKQYKMKPIGIHNNREVRRVMAELGISVSDKSKIDIAAVPGLMSRIDELVDMLQHVPEIGADWERIMAEADEEDLIEALQIMLEMVMRPFSKISGVMKGAR